MNRKQRIRLFFILILLILVLGVGGFALYRLAPAHWTTGDIEIILPLPQDELQYIYHINGWGEKSEGEFHNGIDFDVNNSVEIIAWCDLRINTVEVFFNEGNGCWQTNVRCSYNWKYRFDVAFENWGTNESAALLQKEALTIKPGQMISQGESMGVLLEFIGVTHLHFGLEEDGESVCPYDFMAPSVQSEFSTLYSLYGSPGEDICAVPS